MLPRWSFTLLLAAISGCGSTPPPCARAVPGAVGSFDGYEVIAGDRGAIVVDGTGPLPWRALYGAPRNCGAPGDGAGNPMLLALLRSKSVELVDADGCGDEEVVVSSEPAAVELGRRVGALLARRRLRERVTIRVRCASERTLAG